MSRVHFGSGIFHELYYARDQFASELFRVNLLSGNLVQQVSYLLTELTVKFKLFSTVNITSNWISEIQQCFLSTQQPCGRIQYFDSKLLGNNILAFTFNFD